MSSKRQVRIVLEARSDQDSAALLRNIAEAFSDEDIDIALRPQADEDDGPSQPEVIDEQLEAHTIEQVQDALDAQDVEASVKKSSPSAEEFLERWRTLRDKLSFEGIKVAIQTIVKSAIQTLFGG